MKVDKETMARRATGMKECRHGTMLFLHLDSYVGKSLDLYGEFSRGEGKVFAQLLGPGDIVFEVGANIGAHTVHLAQLVGPHGMVLAFEPQRVIFQILCANVALNELFNVHTYQAAVAQAKGVITLPPINYLEPNNFGSLPLRSVASGNSVQVMTLDSFDLPSVRLLKIDAEGGEYGVLLGAKRMIARHRPILYVENDRRENSERLIALIEELGYDMWWDTPPFFAPDNYASCAENVFPGMGSVNLLCLPHEAGIASVCGRRVASPTDWWNLDEAPPASSPESVD